MLNFSRLRSRPSILLALTIQASFEQVIEMGFAHRFGQGEKIEILRARTSLEFDSGVGVSAIEQDSVSHDFAAKHEGRMVDHAHLGVAEVAPLDDLALDGEFEIQPVSRGN